MKALSQTLIRPLLHHIFFEATQFISHIIMRTFVRLSRRDCGPCVSGDTKTPMTQTLSS